MDPPFYSPRRRLARAKDHISDLKGRVQLFSDTNVRTVTHEADRNGVHNLWKFKLKGPIPHQIEDATVEALAALRDALDQSGYESARLASRPLKRTHFPFANTEDNLKHAIRKCKDVPPQILTFMLSFKPYKAGNPLLYALNEAANRNKHRLLIPFASALGVNEMNEFNMIRSGLAIALPPLIKIINLRTPHPLARKLPFWDRHKNEIVFAIFEPGADLKVEFQASISIVFDDIEGVGDTPILRVLDRLTSVVESIVDGIEAECRRLGFLT